MSLSCFRFFCIALTWVCDIRIVEFASQEDSQRAIRELSEQPLLGRPVFIREVCHRLWHDCLHSHETQDRENESRFGATPVPGKIGMAMAGQGLTVGPPPRPAYHNSFGQNPGNQLYVGNVCILAILSPSRAHCLHSCPTRLAGRT